MSCPKVQLQKYQTFSLLLVLVQDNMLFRECALGIHFSFLLSIVRQFTCWLILILTVS